jgi:hypothetical protein
MASDCCRYTYYTFLIEILFIIVYFINDKKVTVSNEIMTAETKIEKLFALMKKISQWRRGMSLDMMYIWKQVRNTGSLCVVF